MNRKKKAAIILSMAMGFSLLSGCGNGSSEENTYEINLNSTSMIESANDVEFSREGMVLNDLTGEWVDESFANKRPVAIMINNLSAAMPQSGIGQADIIYEMLVEGGITRLMAIYTDYSGLEKIGPVRSARHYYDRKAMEFDAIYAHVGQSVYAEADFSAYSQLDNLNGLYGVGNVMFYRDSSRKAPHNCYTSADGIDAGIEYEGYDTTHDENFRKMFSFNSSVQSLDGNPANKITTAYNSSRQPYFEYNSEDGLYYRYQYGGPQIDDQTDEQLKFQNVIIQFAPHSPLEAELIDINWVGSGEGYYASNGTIIPITWSKSSDNSVTRYYTIDGEELRLNPGKTWITVFPDNQKDGIIIE